MILMVKYIKLLIKLIESIKVIVQEKPDAPSKGGISKVESRSISVTWSPPYSGNSLIGNDLMFSLLL